MDVKNGKVPKYFKYQSFSYIFGLGKKFMSKSYFYRLKYM